MAGNDPAQDQLIIQTGGQKLEGWTAEKVVRGVELCPSHFEIQLTEKFPGSGTEAVVVPGSTCTVYLGGDLVLTGYIDDYLPEYNAMTHTVTISGRSNTEDVVDSSYTGGFTDTALNGPWSVNTGSLKSNVQKILEQFPNVGLTMIGDDVQLKYPYSITPGESAYSVIENLCRMASRLLWDDKNGNLVISKVGTSRAGSALVEGEQGNVEAAAARIDWSLRYHDVFVINSAQSVNSTHIDTLGHAVDDQIRKGRVKLIIADSNLGPDNQLAKQRAQWEMNRRKGRSEIVQVHVTGWRDGSGALWTPNTIVSCQLPTLKVNADLVIAEAEWIRSDDTGTQTILTLMPAGALEPEPYLPPFGLLQG